MTLLNSIWSFSSATHRKSFLTNFTNTRLFTCMCREMLFSGTFLGKSFIAYFTKYKAFPGNVCLGYISGEMHCSKYHKHEAFYLYVSRNECASVRSKWVYVEILSCMLLKYEAYRLYLSKNVFTSGLFQKILSCTFHKQCMYPKMLL